MADEEAIQRLIWLTTTKDISEGCTGIGEYLEEDCDGLGESLQMAIDALSKNLWIPITYDANGKLNCRMPEYGQCVIVNFTYNGDNLVDIEHYYTYPENPESYFGDIPMKDMIAWMPMPEPYKGDK